ncbi:carboxymuconolactone decarboxylase family protein [Pigmentibacter sp. JX0631]|uniref:carboxymuconolactone decarboxylase family protein n=1 Tax=Pigmentibacter sp. JX0631 TaxID=2976982 RepID=UPI002469C01B|nr:carboxymuconolactone decarboxylase family protein [Pigmentibacter sp. JX0631]WGL59415.1 carboxymuconolactone decarboxylase family protein [Pigmentibacter sp. JX0631]
MENLEYLNIFIDKYTGNLEGIIPKDLKLNFSKLLSSGDLTTDEKLLLLICISKSLNFQDLYHSVLEVANLRELEHSLINEAIQIPAIMGMLNTYYKFKYFSEKNFQSNNVNYGAPNLRMQSLMNTKLPKETFELLSIAVSILNSCEKCVVAHEKALLELSVPVQKIHTVMKFAAVTKGLSYL